MPNSASTLETQAPLQLLNQALQSGIFAQAREMLAGTPAVDIAHLIESSPPHIRDILWRLIEKEDEAEILQHLSDDIRTHFLSNFKPDELAALCANLQTDDLVDMLQDLPNTITEQVLQSMGAQNRLRIETALSFAEDTAGGLMNTDTITIRPNISLEVAQRYLRGYQELPQMTDALFVVNRQDHYVGRLTLSKLLIMDPAQTVGKAMDTELEPLKADMAALDVAQRFERMDLVSAPVVNDQGKLLGRITVDDVVDVIREEADHNIMSTVGLDEDADTFAPVLRSSRRRATWLGINLLTAILASGIIWLFRETISEIVALAILMPIVASMGGIAGTQSLTLIIRGLALGQIGMANVRWVIMREVSVGLLNGFLWATVVGVAASLWFQEPLIGYLIASAMLFNQLIAAVAGSCIPLLLKRIGVDPAIAGGVILTTITDIAGFFCFLGLATIFY